MWVAVFACAYAVFKYGYSVVVVWETVFSIKYAHKQVNNHIYYFDRTCNYLNTIYINLVSM